MSNGQVFALMLIVLGVFGIWMESQCKFGAFLRAIYDGPSFVEFIIALIIFLSVLSIVGEPASSWIAAIVILGMLFLDLKVNGNQNIWRQLGITK